MLIYLNSTKEIDQRVDTKGQKQMKFSTEITVKTHTEVYTYISIKRHYTRTFILTTQHHMSIGIEITSSRINKRSVQHR